MPDEPNANVAFTHKLMTPVKAHGEDVAELSFRKPRGGDITKFGLPVTWEVIGENPRVDFDGRRMSLMLAELANVPPSSIDMLEPQDWTACAWGLAGFFVPARGV